MLRKNRFWLYATLILSLSISTYTNSTNVNASVKHNYQTTTTPKVSADENVESGFWGDCPWKLNITTGVLQIGDPTKTTTGSNTRGITPFDRLDLCKSIDIVGKVNLPEDSSGLFSLYDPKWETPSSISKINHLDRLNTENTKIMSYMFGGDGDLQALDVSNFKTQKVNDMSLMFSNCRTLTNLNLSSFDTSHVTDMKYMFEECNDLSSLNLSNFITSNVQRMDSMFYACSNLVNLNVSSFDTKQVTTMNSMFEFDKSLKNLDLSSFDTPNVTDVDFLVSQCTDLEKLNLANFNTKNVEPEKSNILFVDKNVWSLTLGKNVTNDFLKNQEYQFGQPYNQPIPSTNPVKYATGPGWIAVDQSKGGTDTNPQGTLYSNYATFAEKRPAETETYVWQQETTPVDQYTLDANKSQDLYQGQTWDPTSAITSATKNGTDDKSNVTITDKKDGNAVTQDSVAKLNPGTYDLTYKNGDKTSTLTLTIKSDLASLKTTNIELYLNKSFKDADLRDNIDSKDSDGNPLNYQYSIKDASGTVPVDQVSSKKGQYTVEITTDKPKDGKAALKGTLIIKVTDRSALNLKYTTDTITVGQAWKPEDAFKNATDAKGDNLAFKDIKVTATDTTDSKHKPVKDLSSLNTKAGTYTIHYANGSAEQDLKLTVQAPSTPSTPATPSTPTTSSSSSSSSSSTSSTSSSTPTSSSSSSSSSNTSLPSYVAAKGTVVYSINKISLYKSTKFSANNRSAWYTKKPRVYRPMFVVTGYKRAANGALRYRVRDVNHTSKTNGKTGYITASQKYVRPVYYATKHSTVTVINPRGVNAYRKANLTKKARSYRQGTVLHVKRIVSHNLTTRYVLTNGDYITANRKLVNMGRHKQVKSVKTKRTLNRYSNANFTKKNQVIAKNRTLKVYGYDYSQKNNVTKHGTLRYRVAGGYITANTKYVRVYK
ncbi:BspA family leucine-rich repeat surface protein [Lentilactobacillus hilgardii]|uniref:BspA family leucine-rich repeat surface protein n=1 Tax=Lentilactobacillus hilgardii TaxID=1588 RepID=UPI00019C5037|nr:bacterial surface protein 26-residue PARCEL repeat (3 repeats) [Lentilactobacillus hilgardii ATCC 27305]